MFSERSERSGEGELISVTINSGVVKASELDRKDNSSDDKSNYKKVEVGDIAYNSMRMWQGASGYSPYNGILSPAYTVIIPKKDIDSKFFAYDFKRYDMIQTFKRNSQGLTSDTWNLKFPTLKSVKVMVPSIEEQKQISTFFESLDTTITLHQQKLDQLKRLKQGFLQILFGNKEQAPKVRFAGFDEEWEQRKLGEVVECFEYGLNAAAREYDGKNKYLRITDIDEETHLFKSEKLTSPDINLSNADNYKLKENDVLFARTGASVGKTYRYRLEDGLIYYAGFLIRARIKSEFSTEFIFQNTLTSKYNQYIKIASQRSGQPGVNAQEYSKFELFVPNLEEQQKIGSFFKQLDDAIALHQTKLEKLKQLKKAFLQKMFI